MKNKTLKQLIKDKANDVYVKDFSLEIIEKARVQVDEPMVHKKQAFRLRLKPVFAFSLALVTTVVLVFLWTPSLSDDPLVIESYDQALMTASISMIYAYDDTVNQNVSLLSSQTFDQAYMIEDELDELNGYLPLIEQFFESHVTFDKEKISIEATENLYHLKFTAKTLSNQYIAYELLLFDSVVKNGNLITIEGHISLLDITYPIVITFNQNQPEHFLMTSLLENDQEIEIFYENINQEAIYQLKMIDQEEILKQITLKRNLTQQTIDLNFEKGAINGTYRFRMSDEKVLGVTYAIIRDNMSETGRMVISVTPREHMIARYVIEVSPQGGIPFNREEEREPIVPTPRPRPMPARGPLR